MPSLASGSQGRRRLDVEVAVPARDDGISHDAVEGRTVTPGAPDPRRGARRRQWRSFPPLQCSLGRLGFVGQGVCGGAVNLVLRAVAPTHSL
jgi:hypothetical protein